MTANEAGWDPSQVANRFPLPVQHPEQRAAYGIGCISTRYLVDDLNPTGYGQVVEEIVSGAVTRQYTYGLQRISENQVISSAWTPSFYGYDGGGTVRQLTSIAGAVTDAYEYDAWGNEVGFTGTTPNNYLYRAEQYDPDLGLYYLRARYYNPITGRFLSRDPEYGNATDPRTLHKYLYAGGDPVNALDPTGRDDEEEEPTIIDIIAAKASKKIFTLVCLAHYVVIRAIWETSGGKNFPWWPTVACSVGGIFFD